MVTECTSCAKLPPPHIPPCLGGRAAGRGGGGAPTASSSPIPLPESSDIGSNIEKCEKNRTLSLAASLHSPYVRTHRAPSGNLESSAILAQERNHTKIRRDARMVRLCSPQVAASLQKNRGDAPD